MITNPIALLRAGRRLVQGFHPRVCCACGYEGRFTFCGMPPRVDGRCPRCKSVERHRLLLLTDTRVGLFRHDDSVLHVAPEAIVQRHVRQHTRDYVSLDLYDRKADVQEPLESTTFPDSRFDVVLCSHVLEHVDDRQALKEIHRILKPGGRLVAMVPITEGCETTYEDPARSSELERTLHFGQWDHVRFYGRDFRDRLRDGGFTVAEHTADGEDVAIYSLMRGEKVFVCTRSH